MNKPYPIRLDTAPLFEMIVEIRFDSVLPPDAVFGMAYPKLHEYFKLADALPILNVPADMRNADPSLIQQPHYQFSGGELPLVLLIGPKVVTIKYERFSTTGEVSYPGWRKSIKGFIEDNLKELLKLIQVTKIDRLGIRYVDFFEDIELFSNITPTFHFPDRKLKSANVKCVIEEEGMSHSVNLSNSATFYNITTGKQKEGSIIDIDTSMTNVDLNEFLESSGKILTGMHDLNKDLFYEVMEEDLVNKYNPIKEEVK